MHQRAREYLKRQLTKRGIAFEPLDNGILSCSDPEAMQRLADGLTADKIDALLRKWLARLPHPFSANDRKQGIRYDISMLQAEFARTEVFDPQWTGKNRPFMDTSKPAISGGPRLELRSTSRRPLLATCLPARQR